MQRHLSAFVAFFFLLLFASARGFALVEVPPPADGVVDTTGVLGPHRADLVRKVQTLRSTRGTEVGVLVVDSIQPEEIEQYSIRVADRWKAGRAKIDDGVILVVALEDRRVRIEVGRGLEGVIPDVIANRIIHERILPFFRSGDFPGGINAGVDSIIALASGGGLPPPNTPETQVRGDLFALVVFGFLFGSLFAVIFGSLLGSGLSGVLGFMGALFLATPTTAIGIGLLLFVLVLLREPIFTVLNHSGGRVRYGGGGFGGGGSGGGFGGGGTFSGGGASGRW